MFRILITGSRDWTDDYTLMNALAEYYDNYGADGVTVVHGACPTGADAMASEFVRLFGGIEESYPADWSKGRSAGPRRNKHMVSLGADVCLAFISKCTSPRCDIKSEHWSHGATGTSNEAVLAGIDTVRYYEGK